VDRTNIPIMSVHLDDDIRALIDARTMATLSTVNPDGSPQSTVVWIDRDDDTLLVSVVSHRRKARNLARDPRLSLTLFDVANPYFSVQIVGTAELVPDERKELPVRLSQKYLGIDPPGENPDERRLAVRITPIKVTAFGRPAAQA
jgi:PPOX class probable F420-dependent enzyme